MSSILIKNMKIPKSCGECLDIGWHYVFDCRLDDAEEGERLPNCPLVPVPPHGRLIDADTLKASLVFAEETAEWAVPALRVVLMIIDKMPTIIPASEEETE